MLMYTEFIDRLRRLGGMLLVLVSCAGALPVQAQQPPESLPFDNPDPDSLPIAEALDLVLQAQMSRWDAEYVTLKAGASGDVSYIAQLKQIAPLYAPTYSSVAVTALHALWELGEPREYFLGLAQDWAQNRKLAFYAIWTLARDPSPAELAELEAIEEAARMAGANLGSPINNYDRVLFLTKSYKEEPTLIGKADLILGFIDMGLRHIITVDDSLHFNRSSSGGNLYPGAVWGRYALRGMAQQHPDSVRHYIDLYRSVLAEDHGPERGPIIARDFGDYVEQEAFREGPVWLPSPTLPDLPGAITLAAPAATASFSGGTFTISGFDHTTSGAPAGSGDDAHGLLATSTAVQQSLLDALAANQQSSITGTGPAPDIAEGTLAFDPAALINELMTRVTDTLEVEHTGTLGSLEEPVVAYAPEGLTLSGTLTGTGVLLVDGRFREQGSVEWTGLVVVRATETAPAAFEMRGNVGVTGGVVLVSEGAARLEITGSAEVRQSRAVVEMLRTALDLQ